jgi:hypothetical protein
MGAELPVKCKELRPLYVESLGWSERLRRGHLVQLLVSGTRNCAELRPVKKQLQAGQLASHMRFSLRNFKNERR